MKKLKAILDIARNQQPRNFDTVLCITGKERRGKSVLMLHAVDYLGGKNKNIALEGDKFRDVLVNAKKRDVVVLDEAGEALYSRDAMTKQTKTLGKIYKAIGAKQLISILVLPSFFSLDVYFRRHRVDGLLHVYKRGKFVFYDRRGIDNIILKYNRVPVIVTKSDSFKDYKGYLRKDYDKLKARVVAEVGKERDGPNLSKKDKILTLASAGLKTKEIIERLDVNRQYVYEVLEVNKKECRSVGIL